MRIIAGKYKGLSLEFPKSKDIRPTKDVVREGVFSAISSYCQNANVLDCCAGTGAVGIEALSRGAKLVHFVDKDTKFIKSNMSKIKSDLNQDQIKIVKAPILNYLKKCNKKFNIIYLDPPWHDTHLYLTALNLIAEFDILESPGVLVCEYSTKSELEEWVNSNESSTLMFGEIQQYKYGRTRVSIFKKK